ncbi:hydrolase [Mycobacteroides abscessus subsp. bolletii]|uniref:virginiamycin B lyase family protein n=1 Tax=Mycobacteroides abscessus TaxID=36809 RepID=UPI0009CF8702|nr:SMP-30/gluconolactonase/LRE family protein [Mycobacteroides abscessus]SKG70783.1 hydrolase [Mycobacteroides abscessus subsp. bolletii]SLF40858.1 hydrolase [Mycobacteroides abscessus subsp. bolletii]
MGDTLTGSAATAPGSAQSRSLPRWLARFNLRVTNPVQGLWAPHLPPWAVVEHQGRKSGRWYSTPVLAFPVAGGLAIGLPYGADSQWVLNLLASTQGRVVRGGRTMTVNSVAVVDGSSPTLPPAARLLSRLSGRALVVSGFYAQSPGARSAVSRPRALAHVVAVIAATLVRTLIPSFAAPAATSALVRTKHKLGRLRGPATITAGPDGNLWFTESLANKIGRITPDGQVTEFSAGLSRGSAPDRITAGPDGNLWFTQVLGNTIGRITPDGQITEFAGLSPNSGPFGITAGPDGNLWFTETRGNRIGRITPDGQITEFPSGSNPLAMPTDIVAGPDGNLWYTERFGGIGRITPAGVVTTFTGVSFGAGSVNITAGPDGALWFVETFANKIGRISTDGEITEYRRGLSRGAMPVSITTGPDGNLWFTEYLGSRVGRITPAGTITELVGLSPLQVPDGITLGPDGALWFVEVLGSRVNRLDISELVRGSTISAVDQVVSTALQ